MIKEVNPPEIVVVLEENGQERLVGRLEAVFWPQDGHYGIADMYVDHHFRRGGIAKAMLRVALRQALALNASSMGGGISSREALDLARDLVGDEPIDVKKEGSHHSPESGQEDVFDTDAVVVYKLPEF